MTITFDLDGDGGASDFAVNLSNVNAAAMLTLAGRLSEPFGEVSCHEVHGVVQRLLRAANTETLRRPLTSRSVERQAVRAVGDGAVVLLERGAVWTECGRSDEYIGRRTVELLTLFREAARRGCGVAWG